MLISHGKNARLLVVTDLDGTLLTHDYDFSPALDALAGLQANGGAVVLNSSKTVAEMNLLAEKLGFHSPFVAENGGVIATPTCFPGKTFSPEYTLENLGVAHDFIVEKAHSLRKKFNFRFEGFSDWSLEVLISHTGLEIKDAAEAKLRNSSEPILWQDSEERFLEFSEKLARDGIRILRGGRFFHLMGQADKADGLRRVKKLYAEEKPDVNWLCVALGDSENDLKMLEAADIAVVIPRLSGQRLRPNHKRVIHAPKPSPAGWNQVILELLNEFCPHP